VRSDPSLKADPAMAALGRMDPREMDLTVQFSGSERDYVFCNRGGTSFDDVSLVSGLDHPGDARGLAILDLDRDGWPDLALANANTPQLVLFRNRQGDARKEGTGPPPAIAFRFVGGKKDAVPAPDGGGEKWSPRDGYGAQVKVALGTGTLLREQRCGEGMSSQNSATLLVGLGDAARAKDVRVRWPSGRTTELGAVDAGTLVTVFENPAENGGQPARLEPYRPAGAALALANALAKPRPRSAGAQLSAPNLPALAEDGLVVYTSMATWCQVCRGELPQVARLRESFAAGEVELVAVPIDATDDEAKLSSYLATYHPRYDLRADLGHDPVFRGNFSGVVQAATGLDGLPSSVVTDRSGRVVHAMAGVPSVSDLRRLRKNLPR
jgi:thiol-disulfide isomerase/thioredoxin